MSKPRDWAECPVGEIMDFETRECVRMSRMQKKAYKVLNGFLDEIRTKDLKVHKQAKLSGDWDDPVADTRIVLDDDLVMLTYDGAGYNYFSYESDGFFRGDMEAEFEGKPERWGKGGFVHFSTSYRSELERRLEKANPDFFIEDNNSWSLIVAGTGE